MKDKEAIIKWQQSFQIIRIESLVKDLPTKIFITKLNKETLSIWQTGKCFWQYNSFYSLPSSLNGRFKRKKN
ncbi:hypothetical protein Nmel_009000 [Mimus melanotis]